MKLKDKVAVITGASRGLGKAMALRFAAEGCKIALADISPIQFDGPAGDALIVQADVSKSADVESFIHQTLQKFSKIDVLVNNAGILRDATLTKMSDEQFDQVISVNLRGVFLCGRACAKVMVEQKHGRIINISSVASRGNFGQTNYSAAKAGVIGMTKTWALELSKHGILVNAIAPGLIATEMTQSIPEDVRKKMIDFIPLKRMGFPQEVADLALFLASEDASYIQGEVININGGFLM